MLRWRDRQVHLGVGVEVERQTSPFRPRGDGGGLVNVLAVVV
jgi:hypothetical protein